MTVPFASIVIHKFVTTVGPYVGFASIIAVAILVLLYFAHARETATLRERLDEAQQRIGGLEARVSQLLHAQAGGQRARAGTPAAPAPVPVTPAPVRPMGSAVSSVRRVPTPTPAGAAPTPAPASAAAAARAAEAAGLAPAAAAGMAAPALASATKLIPDPETYSSNGEPDDTMFVPARTVAAAAAGRTPATAAAAGNGQAKSEQTASLAEATQAMPAVAAAAARTPTATPKGAGGVASPPRVKLGSEPAAAAEGAGTAATGAGSRRPIPGPTAGSRPIPPLAGPGLQRRSGGRFTRMSGRVLPLLIGGIAIIVVIVGLVIIINTGGGSTAGNVAHNSGNGTTGASLSQKQHHHAPPPFKASRFTVAVLNGTAVSNLAADISTKLVGEGYRKGNATNAASQTQSLTLVYYRLGAAASSNKIAAQHVAKALTLPPSRVRPATAAAIQSCSISATGAALKSCSAQVIVSVGSDRANLASGASSG